MKVSFPSALSAYREWATFPSTSGLKKICMFCSSQPHDTKYFVPSLCQFTPKICWLCFPQPVSLKRYGLCFPQAHHSAYLFCSPQPQDTKHLNPSLSQFTPKICRFRCPQPCRLKIYMGYDSLSLMTQKPYLFCPLNLQQKIFGSFPQPISTKNM